MSLKKNDDIELFIDSVSLQGSGVGRYEGMAVFVPATAKGDKVNAHIIKAKKSYAIGKVKKILKPSKDRTGNDCHAFPACGGCCFRHMKYDAELKLKRDAVKDVFERIGKINIEPEDIIGADEQTGYRNKAQYPVRIQNGELKIGFYAQHSHRIIECLDCRLAPDEFKTILEVFENWIKKNKISVYDEEKKNGLLRHIYIRKAFATDEIMVCAVASDILPHTDKLKDELLKEVPSIKSLILNINDKDTNVVLGHECKTLWGKDYIEDILCNVKIRISPLSFYQVNRNQAQKLYAKAAEYADVNKDMLLLDLYCGAGTIGLSMADKVKELIGVETVAEAIEDAKLNAKENNIENAHFICADAGQAAQKFLTEGKKPDVIILDPPRKGCSDDTLEAAAKMMPERIVYVSCDPASLARDCDKFKALGYFVKEVTPVDMFPRTAHVESVALLEKEN